MADVTKTREDLIARALTELGKLVAGQNVEEEDEQTVDDLVDPLLQQLSIDGVVYIGNPDAIEPEYFLPLARLLANEAGPSFGIPKNEDIKRLDETTLRRLTAGRPTYQPLVVDYF